MELSFDPAKRRKTLEERDLDFADAAKIFAGRTLTALDDRDDYGEDRYITYGYLEDRAVILVWTPRDETRRIISMRYANDRERHFYEAALD
ncbi:MAG: BrnT family toxin [Pseudomonadota bacterium]|uniref:BrnT family toxin n=1 Tax=Sphingobium sp. TaxID=1912891 RepID=UPI002E1C773A